MARGDESVRERPGGDGDRGSVAPGRRDGGVAEREHHDPRGRQKEKFGGFNIGAAFFGWLVAIGLGAILLAIVSAIGGSIASNALASPEQAAGSADTIGIAGGIVLLLVLMLAYFAGGYVAGRMSRFDGVKQGIGVWVIGLLITIALAILGAVAGSQYNVLAQLKLPRIPVDEGSLATGGLIALAAVLIGTLIAAALGGKVGQRYHAKVDRAGGLG
jgi:amino acid transporter